MIFGLCIWIDVVFYTSRKHQRVKGEQVWQEDYGFSSVLSG